MITLALDNIPQVSVEETVNRACALELLLILFEHGALEKGLEFDFSSLLKLMGVLEGYERFLKFILLFLEKQGLLASSAGKFVSLFSPDELYSTFSVNKHLQKLGEFQAPFLFLKECIRSYPEILSGKKSPLSILFPGGDVNFLKQKVGFLIDTPDMLRAKSLLRKKVLALLTEKDFKDILEVGGGSGSLTWFLAPVLAKEVNYHFTDISRFFTLRAENEATARGLSNISFSTFDISKSPAQQNYALASRDLILAYNVLHVVPDMRCSLEYLYSLLRRGGYLILLESTKVLDWVVFIWGMLPAWWKQDSLRQQENGPLLAVNVWKNFLKDTEFSSVTYFPDEVSLESADTTLVVLRK